MKKKYLSLLLALCMALGMLPALGEGELTQSALHIGHPDDVYGTESYLYDTLTLAGSAFDTVQTFTVAALEKLAQENPALGYENTYSMMTSGGEYSHTVYTGIRLYELMLEAGMDASLPDNTPVRIISKDGYASTYKLSDIRAQYSSYAAKGDTQALDSTLPVLLAFGANGAPLVGPTGDQPVTKRFKEEDGFVQDCNNIGGPLRQVMGMTASTEFNSLNCAKWVAAIVVGDSNGYAYARQVEAEVLPEIDRESDWSHAQDAFPEYRLTVRGSQAKETQFTLQQLESLSEGIVRDYFAASAGVYAYEGVTLRTVVQHCLAEGVTVPDSITLVSADGFTRPINVNDVMQGIDSMYQPGEHRDILLAYAIGGAPMVQDKEDPNYNGTNAYGPVRLVVENTISAWVKDVVEIIIGE